MEGFRSADLNRATDLVKTLDKTVSKAFPQMQDALDRSLTKQEKDNNNWLMRSYNKNKYRISLNNVRGHTIFFIFSGYLF